MPRPFLAETDPDGQNALAPAAQTDKSAMALAGAKDPLQSSIALPPGLNFSKVSHAGFLEVRRDLIEAVHESSTGLSTSQYTSNALIGLAELHLAHALIAEGQSILTGLEGTTLSKEQIARIAGISMALNILDPWGMELSEADILVLEGPDQWPGHALFRSLYYAKKGEQEKTAPYLAATVADLLTLPEPIKELILPDLLEVAIDLGDWDVARTFAAIIIQTPALNKGSAYHYLLGRTAEYGRDYLVAFEHYIRATEKLNRWSQLASLAVVRMGLKTETLTLQDAHVILEQIRFAWRGDTISIEVLNFLVETKLSLHDIPAALEVLGEIIYEKYDIQTGEKAEAWSNLLLTEYYGDGASGTISITEFMRGHNRIALDYRFQKGFDLFSEKFADRFQAIGASSVAAYEYETTYNYLSVAQDLGLFEVTSERLDQIHIKQAKSLMRGGQFDIAEPIIAFGAESTDADIREKFIFLKAEFYNLTGNAKSLLDTKSLEPSDAYLQIKAEAYFSLADWKNAMQLYNMLWTRQGSDLEFTNAINLLLSAYRNNDNILAFRLAKAFPDLTAIPQWQQIAAKLVEKRAAVDVLQNDAILEGLSDASEVLEVMELITTPPQ